MFVEMPNLVQSLVNKKTVSIPVNKEDYQTQLLLIPCSLTRFVTRFGVLVEKVVGTIEKPKSHQDIFLSHKKKSLTVYFDLK